MAKPEKKLSDHCYEKLLLGHHLWKGLEQGPDFFQKIGANKGLAIFRQALCSKQSVAAEKPDPGPVKNRLPENIDNTFCLVLTLPGIHPENQKQKKLSVSEEERSPKRKKTPKH